MRKSFTAWLNNRLVGQDRQVLGRRMAEDRTEDAQVEAPSVTRADDCLGIQLIGDADARAKWPYKSDPNPCSSRNFRTLRLADSRSAGSESAIALAIYRLREVQLIATPRFSVRFGVTRQVSCA